MFCVDYLDLSSLRLAVIVLVGVFSIIVYAAVLFRGIFRETSVALLCLLVAAVLKWLFLGGFVLLVGISCIQASPLDGVISVLLNAIRAPIQCLVFSSACDILIAAIVLMKCLRE